MPGPTEAEPWEVWIFGGKSGEPQIVQICQTPLDNRLRKNTTLALPVAQVFCLPLWLNETDPRQFAGMIPLQLELRGLQPRKPASRLRLVGRRAGRHPHAGADRRPARASLPESSTRKPTNPSTCPRATFRFPANALTLWREHDRLVVAITHGGNLVYFQALPEAEITPRVIQDLNCARATLEMQDILQPLQRVVFWTPVKPEERTALAGGVQSAHRRGGMPAAGSPRRRRGNSRRPPSAKPGAARKPALDQAPVDHPLLLYLGVGRLVRHAVCHALAQGRRPAQMAGRQHAEAIDLVENGRAMWKELAPVVDTKHYPLELLLHAQQAIPADQLHLTLFESNSEGHLLIKGEAKNVAGAFHFSEKLKGDPYFTGYNLNMGNPRPLPNDLASFQIEGTRATTNP